MKLKTKLEFLKKKQTAEKTERTCSQSQNLCRWDADDASSFIFIDALVLVKKNYNEKLLNIHF